MGIKFNRTENDYFYKFYYASPLSVKTIIHNVTDHYSIEYLLTDYAVEGILFIYSTIFTFK